VIGKSRKRRVVAIVALVIAAAPFAAFGSNARGDSSGPPPGRNNEIRKLQGKEFLRAHSDASGKPRPDLWRKGVEQQKHMQVAPYIGWKAPAPQAKPTK
jgi:hypothetical protein